MHSCFESRRCLEPVLVKGPMCGLLDLTKRQSAAVAKCPEGGTDVLSKTEARCLRRLRQDYRTDRATNDPEESSDKGRAAHAHHLPRGGTIRETAASPPVTPFQLSRVSPSGTPSIVATSDAAHATRRSPSSCRSHLSRWFQLANIGLATTPVQRSQALTSAFSREAKEDSQRFLLSLRASGPPGRVKCSLHVDRNDTGTKTLCLRSLCDRRIRAAYAGLDVPLPWGHLPRPRFCRVSVLQ